MLLIGTFKKKKLDRDWIIQHAISNIHLSNSLVKFILGGEISEVNSVTIAKLGNRIFVV